MMPKKSQCEYIMHDWQSGECDWPTEGCVPPDDFAWALIYIQDAIDYHRAKPCPECMGDGRADRIAYNIWVEERARETER